MNVKLDSIDPWTPELHLSVNQLPAVIGRNSDSDVEVDGRWVSHKHCEIIQENGTLVVRDLRSEHGTLINGESVDRAPLLPGDELTVGVRTLRVTYRQSKRGAGNDKKRKMEQC